MIVKNIKWNTVFALYVCIIFSESLFSSSIDHTIDVSLTPSSISTFVYTDDELKALMNKYTPEILHEIKINAYKNDTPLSCEYDWIKERVFSSLDLYGMGYLKKIIFFAKEKSKEHPASVQGYACIRGNTHYPFIIARFDPELFKGGSQEKLKFAVDHETAHILCKHCLFRIDKRNDFIALYGSYIQDMIQKKIPTMPVKIPDCMSNHLISRYQEIEADEVGILLHREFDGGIEWNGNNYMRFSLSYMLARAIKRLFLSAPCKSLFGYDEYATNFTDLESVHQEPMQAVERFINLRKSTELVQLTVTEVLTRRKKGMLPLPSIDLILHLVQQYQQQLHPSLHFWSRLKKYMLKKVGYAPSAHEIICAAYICADIHLYRRLLSGYSSIQRKFSFLPRISSVPILIYW